MTSETVSPDRVAAFFDIDGTLLPDPSLEWRFIAYLLAHDDIDLPRITGWLASFIRQFPFSPRAAILQNKSYLQGLPKSLAETWQRSLIWSERSGEVFANQRLAFFAEAISRMEWHAAQRHRIFLLSGTIAPLARIVAAHLSPQRGCGIEVAASELEVREGFWTGKLAGPHVSRDQKALAIKRLADRDGLTLCDCFVYANSLDDLAALESVGHPHVVNPHRRLSRHAMDRRWPVLHWRSADPDAQCKSAIAVQAGEAR